jgi:hypothetical protein
VPPNSSENITGTWRRFRNVVGHRIEESVLRQVSNAKIRNVSKENQPLDKVFFRAQEPKST